MKKFIIGVFVGLFIPLYYLAEAKTAVNAPDQTFPLTCPANQHIYQINQQCGPQSCRVMSINCT